MPSNLQLLLPQLVAKYDKGEVEKALLNEQLGENSNRYFAKPESVKKTPASTHLIVSPKFTKQKRCFCLKKDELDDEILFQLEQGINIALGMQQLTFSNDPFVTYLLTALSGHTGDAIQDGVHSQDVGKLRLRDTVCH